MADPDRYPAPITTADVLAIERVLALCGHLLDAEAWDRLGEVFAEDVEFDVTDLRMPLVTGLPALARHFDRPEHPVAHHSTNTVLTPIAADRVEAHSKYLLPRHDGTVASGDYFDELVRTDAGWRIRRRRATLRRQRQLPATSRARGGDVRS